MKNIDGNATASTPDNSEFMSLSQPVEGECNIETEKGKEKEDEKKNKLLFGLKNLFKNINLKKKTKWKKIIVQKRNLEKSFSVLS